MVELASESFPGDKFKLIKQNKKVIVLFIVKRLQIY